MPFLLGLTDERTLTPEGRDALAKDFTLRSSTSIPAWVKGTTATFQRPIFNRESPALRAARTKIAAAVHGRASCEIVVSGDSKSAPYLGAVVPWPEQLRGMLNAADGFVQADDGASDSRWAVVGMDLSPKANVGVRPNAVGSTRRTDFTSREAFTRGDLLMRITGGGSATLTVDGVARGVTIPSVSGWHLLSLGELSNAPHAVTIETTLDLHVAGIVLAYDEVRLRVSNPSRPSSNAADWTSLASTGRWATLLDGPATSADVVISALGTNEIDDLAAVTAYYDQLATLGVPVIVVSPGALGSARTRAQAEALANHLYGIAQRHDWPLIDLELVIGTYEVAAAHLLVLDTLHENTRAALLEALAIYALIFGGLS